MASDHSAIGRLGSFELHSRYDSRKLTENARAASPGGNAYWERKVVEYDPSIAGNAAEIARRAEYAKKAHFQRLALASAKARRKGRS
jgi:hypothetical protein